MCIFGEQISRTFFVLHDWNPKLTAQLPIFPSTTSGNYHPNFCFYSSHYIDDIQMRSCHICTSEIGLFHLTWCPQGPSILSHMTGLPSFLRLSDHPLYICSQSLTYNGFHLQWKSYSRFFNFTMLQKWYAFSRNCTLYFEFLSFPRLAVCYVGYLLWFWSVAVSCSCQSAM